MKIGFIGGGNMGFAMISALAKFSEVCVYARSKNEVLRQMQNVKILADEISLTEHSDAVVLAVKPKDYAEVLAKIKAVSKGKIIICIAPNFTLSEISAMLNEPSVKLVRAMPNTPTAIAQGVSAICFSQDITSNEQGKIKEIFSRFGRVYELEESKFGAFTAIAGSLPAYVFMFIEAVADGGVRNGISRDLAYEIIAASVAGSANLALQTAKHPAKLKDEVCSPGGTTIEAVKVLENRGFRAALIEAVDACVKKANG